MWDTICCVGSGKLNFKVGYMKQVSQETQICTYACKEWTKTSNRMKITNFVRGSSWLLIKDFIFQLINKQCSCALSSLCVRASKFKLNSDGAITSLHSLLLRFSLREKCYKSDRNILRGDQLREWPAAARRRVLSVDVCTHTAAKRDVIFSNAKKSRRRSGCSCLKYRARKSGQ